MRAFVVPSVFLVGFVVSSAACASSGEAPESLESTGTVTQPVINGTIDTSATNNAVVQLQGDGLCTGTVFKKTASATWILTAAHCVPTSRVYVGPDSSNELARYNVASYVADERYGDGQSQLSLDYDVAVVKVDGNIVEATEIELVGTTDTLAVGTGVTSYGYGKTTGYDVPDNNTRRRSIDRTIATLTATSLSYDQGDGKGICAGDSGGPVVFGTGAARRVVGVHSTVGNVAGQEQCFGQANSIRVSARHDFIDAAVAGTALPQLGACEACIEDASQSTTCRQKRQKCQADTECAALADCLQEGGGEACITQYEKGIGPYLDVFECGCADACATQCAGQTACADVSKCGVAFNRATYNTCIETSCCAEVDAAAADGLGYVCLGAPTTAGCATNAKYQAFDACSKLNCDTKKGSSSGSTSSSGTPEEEEQPEEESPSEEPSTTKRANKDEGGCSVSTTGAQTEGRSPAALLFAICAGMAIRSRRRRA